MATKRQTLSPEQATLELINRQKAMLRLVDYSSYLYKWYRPGRHHRIAAEYLEQVELYIRTKGEEGIGRLMLLQPPRHGKTEQASRHFPSWVLGKNPDSRVILTSYGADLANENSRKVREIVISQRFAALFGAMSALEAPVALSEDSRSVSSWELSEPHRGGVVAAGVGGGITGKGAHLLVIDDPFKNREQAESEAYRQSVMSWYGSSAYTRLEDGGAIVIINTRWHREDLSGQLLKAMKTDPLADQWVVVEMPALAFDDDEYAIDDDDQAASLLEGIYRPRADMLDRQPGEALWPEKFSIADLLKIKANLESTGNGQDWYALYQQQPRPAEGAFFATNDFKIIDKAPENLTWYRYVDLALGKTKAADWNATAAVAMDNDGNLYIRDMVRVHAWEEFEKRLPFIMLDPLESGVQWGIEAVAFQTVAFQNLLKNKKLANIAITAITPEADKVTRARPVQTRAKAGKVFLIRGPWNQAFILEALDFPTGKHDDQLDTVSGGNEMIAQGSGALAILDHYRKRAQALIEKKVQYAAAN